MLCRDDTGVVMHKDSKWFQSWQNFKDNNQYVHSKFLVKNTFPITDTSYSPFPPICILKTSSLF